MVTEKSCNLIEKQGDIQTSLNKKGSGTVELSQGAFNRSGATQAVAHDIS